MKIYTKTGDKGTTSLVGGKRVPKNHPRVEAYGDVDELISYIGVVISDTTFDDVIKDLKKIQEDLMLISAHFASDGSAKALKNVTEGDIDFLENGIDNLTAQLPPLKAFVIPGVPRVSSECHVARTVCRRCERHALAIGTGGENNTQVTDSVEIGVRYLNRLSDYLFTLARYLCVKNSEKEEFWLP
ncbi:MAG: cob(I)yrinic acid a,c-diamide adenosyltransferase [Bacteroidales bacterium]|nr:cob(I)yrinic acid a,c-diamide adenosyltransferase [Bacteroidales bacterium]MBQ5783699.1 cob(I)yrinic acid a,c-diamide adenosyltransferase [Bacteroidales bacterium]